MWDVLAAPHGAGRLQVPASIMIRYGFGDLVHLRSLATALARVGKILRVDHSKHWPRCRALRASSAESAVRDQDGRLARQIRGVFFDDLAACAFIGREKQPGVARFAY